MRLSRRSAVVAGAAAVHGRRTAWAVAVALLALTGCTGTAPGGGPATTGGGRPAPPSPARSATAPSPASSGAAEAGTAPQLLDVQRTFIRAGHRTGSWSFPEIPLIRPGALEIAVTCSGSGSLGVRIGSTTSLTVPCSDGDSTQLDTVASDRSRRNVTVSVASRTTGTWGLSVGWTEAVDRHG
ncbi:hypothetical protein [Streptomyces sp. NPDC056785]|uniref:hypothetical protein n=1 Tax=Streptomyces sp. NPDC056785 TaxID=3345944 RepID=UPI0036CE86A4